RAIHLHYRSHASLLLSFFFLLIPPPPSSTLFPYTTLFRSRRWGFRPPAPCRSSRRAWRAARRRSPCRRSGRPARTGWSGSTGSGSGLRGPVLRPRSPSPRERGRRDRAPAPRARGRWHGRARTRVPRNPRAAARRSWPASRRTSPRSASSVISPSRIGMRGKRGGMPARASVGAGDGQRGFHVLRREAVELREHDPDRNLRVARLLAERQLREPRPLVTGRDPAEAHLAPVQLGERALQRSPQLRGRARAAVGDLHDEQLAVDANVDAR